MNGVQAAVPPPSRSAASRSSISKYSSNLDRSWPPSASPSWLHHDLQVHLCITRSRPPSASPNSLDQVSKCISELIDHGLQMHLQTHSIMASKCISVFNLIPASKCISKLALSRPPGPSLSYTILASKCTSKVAQSRPPSAYLSST